MVEFSQKSEVSALKKKLKRGGQGLIYWSYTELKSDFKQYIRKSGKVKYSNIFMLNWYIQAEQNPRLAPLLYIIDKELIESEVY